MPATPATSLFREHRSLWGLALLASLILSVWCVFADPVVNNDGILYLRVAQALRAGELHQALELHHWPFYPALIAAVSSVSSLPVEPAAHVINAVLVALLIWAFLAAALELGADGTTLWLALVVVLLFPGINKFRSFIVRDTGYLAAYFWWLVFLVRYWKEQKGFAAPGLWCCAALTLLFRVEGVVWLLLTPALMAWRIGRLRHWRASAAIGLMVLGAIAALGWWLARTNAVFWKQGTVGAMTELWADFGEQLQYRLLAISEEILGTFSQRYAWWVLILTLLVVVISETLRRLTLVHAGLAWFGYAKGHAFPYREFRGVWIALLVSQLLVLLLFTFLRLFLVDRYTVALGLTIALSVPFALTALKNQRTYAQGGRISRLAYPAALALVLLVGIEALDVRTDKRFLRDAGRWIAAHTAPETRIYANNRALAWYSGRDAFRPGARYDYAETLELIRLRGHHRYDLLALVVGRAPHEEARLRALLGLEPVRVFANPRGDKALVFEIRQ
jgi:hypothetical protein